jgi:hypothetical protein
MVFAAIGAALVLMVLAITGKANAQTQQETIINPNQGIEVEPLLSDSPIDASTPDSSITDGMNMDAPLTITTDPATWPSGDKVWDCCRAIALAEGYNTNGAAFKLNNPGDISDGMSTFGSEYHDGSNITHFPDASTGWNWLYNKIRNHVFGKSSTYPANLTITQFAKKFAGNWQNWKNNVGRVLGVNPDATTFEQYVNS